MTIMLMLSDALMGHSSHRAASDGGWLAGSLRAAAGLDRALEQPLLARCHCGTAGFTVAQLGSLWHGWVHCGTAGCYCGTAGCYCGTAEFTVAQLGALGPCHGWLSLKQPPWPWVYWAGYRCCTPWPGGGRCHPVALCWSWPMSNPVPLIPVVLRLPWSRALAFTLRAKHACMTQILERLRSVCVQSMRAWHRL